MSYFCIQWGLTFNAVAPFLVNVDDSEVDSLSVAPHDVRECFARLLRPFPAARDWSRVAESATESERGPMHGALRIVFRRRRQLHEVLYGDSNMSPRVNEDAVNDAVTPPSQRKSLISLKPFGQAKPSDPVVTISGHTERLMAILGSDRPLQGQE